MGWSSWNHFRVNINEQLIKEQADALIASGLYEAGYRFINIDDGYFDGRSASGQLQTDKTKFPSGMQSLVEYIHDKGLKAGIYTDAGKNTCASRYDHNTGGIGAGIYGHVEDDCQLFFNTWKFDFLKVDWCGGEQMKLDEKTEYTKIIRAVKLIDSHIVFNICRWQFPGTWAITEADSWRVSGDIEPTFSSILKIIDLNKDLYSYSSAGHYNDMDMLQVGRGMTYEEDKTHFSMWCLLNSPLLAGNDLRHMTAPTREILTNKEIIALNQDSGFAQGRILFTEKNMQVWTKPLAEANGKARAIAIMNRGNEDTTLNLDAQRTGIHKESSLRDLWLHQDLGKIGSGKTFTVPRHGIIVLKIVEPKG